MCVSADAPVQARSCRHARAIARKEDKRVNGWQGEEGGATARGGRGEGERGGDRMREGGSCRQIERERKGRTRGERVRERE